MQHQKQNPLSEPNRRHTLLALIGSTLLPACGGGGSDFAGLSSGGTGSFTNGVVVGLGSIIVNGIRYDDSGATISFQNGPSNQAALKLGMVVAIQGSAVKPPEVPGALATATATQIIITSEWKGRVDAVTGADSFTVFGQTVRVLGNSVYASGTLADLAGRYVEVYGFLDLASASLQASRVEVSSTLPSNFRLSGRVTNLGVSTFELGSTLIDFKAASEKPVMQNGMLVRAELQTSQVGGAWVATRILAVDASAILENDDEVEIEGSITAFTSNASFHVNGIAINASRMTVPSGLKLGARVEVRGSVVSGVVQATRVELKDSATIEAKEYEFHGRISSLNTSAKTFVVRGYTVKYVDTTVYEPTSLALANGLDIEVKGRIDTAGLLVARKIEAEH